ncbi:MAG: metallophosphoesterase, partial [archaeon]
MITEKEAIRTLLQMGQLPTVDKIQQIVSASHTVFEEPAAVKPEKTHAEGPGYGVEILQHFEHLPKKIGVADFAAYFRNRYGFLKNILQNRPENSDAISISKLSSADGETTIIAMIADIKKLPTGTLKLTLEDMTGQTSAILSVKNPEMLKKIPFIANDEILAFKGKCGKDTFFVSDVVWPEIPQKTHAISPDDVNIAFCSDLHVGSKMFLPNEFEKFISWLKGDVGNSESKDIAAKTRYVVVLGDVVDGVGVYPEQEKEINITDIYKQYNEAARLLKQIPEDKQVLIIPGNHDAVRLCEPQPALYKDVAAPLYEIPNVMMLQNPSYVKLHKVNGFAGVDLLLYHGYSFDSYVDSIEALR